MTSLNACSQSVTGIPTQSPLSVRVQEAAWQLLLLKLPQLEQIHLNGGGVAVHLRPTVQKNPSHPTQHGEAQAHNTKLQGRARLLAASLT